MITILATGPQTLIEDLGRPGLAHLGVPPSGAADRGALAAANRLVGNDEGAAGLEILLGGLELAWTGTHPLFVALTGAPCPLRVGERDEPPYTCLVLRPGDRLAVRPARTGLRGYLAVRGGIAVPAVLGSRSTDLFADLGPAPVAAGDRLAVGPATSGLPGADAVFPVPFDAPARVGVLPGPRADWFTQGARRTLSTVAWTVAPDSNRTAVRLSGPVLERRITEELPSEGIIRGAVQVPPSGQPLIFLADHPVTGGYPVIAMVEHADDVDRVAQLRPGDALRLTPVS